MADVHIKLHDHQASIVEDCYSRTLVLEGGLGCGKTFALMCKMIERVDALPGIPGLWIEPTFELIGTILIPLLDEFLEVWGIPWSFKTQWQGRHNVLLLYPGEARQTPVYLRSGDKPVRITGFKVGWFIIDEADSCKHAVYTRAAERCRHAGVERMGHVRQRILGYTPEPGFNWTYREFFEKKNEGLRLIEGVSTKANTDLPSDYADEIAAVNDEEQRDRVLTGKRTALTGNVYKRFDVAKHNKKIADPFSGDVFIGADFNWQKMVWVFGTRIHDEIYIWGELIREHTDTIAQCEAAERFIADEYTRARGVSISPKKIIGNVQIVPDASCNQRRAQSAGTASDLDHIIKAGFDVRRPKANPPIIDRVYSVNIGFAENRIFVDRERCPHLTMCLLRQPWDEARQEPSKKEGLDHAPDALGYPVHFYVPRAIMRGNRQGRAA